MYLTRELTVFWLFGKPYWWEHVGGRLHLMPANWMEASP